MSQSWLTRWQTVDEGIAASIRALDVTDLRTAEQSLSALEEKLIAKLKFTADDRTMIELKREVDRELNPIPFDDDGASTRRCSSSKCGGGNCWRGSTCRG